jgi:hypothetical protein
MTESDNIMPTQALINLANNPNDDDSNQSDMNEKYQQLVEKIQELKADLKEKDDNLALKSRLIDQVLFYVL